MKSTINDDAHSQINTSCLINAPPQLLTDTFDCVLDVPLYKRPPPRLIDAPHRQLLHNASRNASHCQQQQSCSGLRSPGR